MYLASNFDKNEEGAPVTWSSLLLETACIKGSPVSEGEPFSLVSRSRSGNDRKRAERNNLSSTIAVEER